MPGANQATITVPVATLKISDHQGIGDGARGRSGFVRHELSRRKSLVQVAKAIASNRIGLGVTEAWLDQNSSDQVPCAHSASSVQKQQNTYSSYAKKRDTFGVTHALTFGSYGGPLDVVDMEAPQ